MLPGSALASRRTRAKDSVTSREDNEQGAVSKTASFNEHSEVNVSVASASRHPFQPGGD